MWGLKFRGGGIQCDAYGIRYHWWSGLFIISEIHVCFLFFLLSWAVQSSASRNSLVEALLLPGCLCIVVLVYNPVLVLLYLVNFLFFGSAQPSLSEILLCSLLSYSCCSLLLSGTPSSRAVHLRSSLPPQCYDC